MLLPCFHFHIQRAFVCVCAQAVRLRFGFCRKSLRQNKGKGIPRRSLNLPVKLSLHPPPKGLQKESQEGILELNAIVKKTPPLYSVTSRWPGMAPKEHTHQKTLKAEQVYVGEGGSALYNRVLISTWNWAWKGIGSQTGVMWLPLCETVWTSGQI